MYCHHTDACNWIAGFLWNRNKFLFDYNITVVKKSNILFLLIIEHLDRIQTGLYYILGDRGLVGKEKADEFDKQGAGTPLTACRR